MKTNQRAASARTERSILKAMQKRFREAPELSWKTAVHEAGHALAAITWGGDIESVSISPDIGSWGRLLRRNGGLRDPEILRRFPIMLRRHEALGCVRVFMAGLAAEEVIIGERADDFDAFWEEGLMFDDNHDIERSWELMFVAFSKPSHDAQMRRMMSQYELVKRYLTEHRDVLEDLARALIEREELDEDAIWEIVGRRVRTARWLQRTTTPALKKCFTALPSAASA